MKEFEKMLIDFCHKYGYDMVASLNDVIDYIIGYFDPYGKPIDGWNKTVEQNTEIFNMVKKYIEVLDGRLQETTWADLWGDLLMSLRTKGGGFEQYFTPVEMCNLMARVTVNDNEMCEVEGLGERLIISDPTCGSGRNLLAAHARLTEEFQKAPYLIAEDIDVICCKLSAVNMAVHGAVGEVVCHNTLLEPDSVRIGYLVNHELYKKMTFTPTIRRCSDPGQFVVTSTWKRRAEKVKSEKKEPTQLSLF